MMQSQRLQGRMIVPPRGSGSAHEQLLQEEALLLRLLAALQPAAAPLTAGELDAALGLTGTGRHLALPGAGDPEQAATVLS